MDNEEIVFTFSTIRYPFSIKLPALNSRRDYQRHTDNHRADKHGERDVLVVFDFFFDRKRHDAHDDKKRRRENQQAEQNETLRKSKGVRFILKNG